LMIFLTLLMSWLEWSDNPERLKRFSFLLSLTSVFASIAMGAISLFVMSNYCLFCILLYVLSFVISLSIFFTLSEGFLTHLAADLSAYFTENKGILGVLVAIPVLSFLTHRTMLSHFGAGEIDRMVNQGVRGWISEPQQTLSVAPMLVRGPEKDKASLVVSEFADFRCGHCKSASHSIHAFTKSHPDVRFEFFVFALDGACNKAIERSSGLSCHLGKAVFCAEKQAQGWSFHDIIFQYQEQLGRVSDVNTLRAEVSKLTSHLPLNKEQYDICLDAAETQEAMEYQSQQGVTLGVQGTPAIFANGRLLPLGQMIPVLEAVYAKSKGQLKPD
jgi:protein-disulfide isomerase